VDGRSNGAVLDSDLPFIQPHGELVLLFKWDMYERQWVSFQDLKADAMKN
jgi:hypothetical protein